MNKQIRIINGMSVEVTICQPSKRRAHATIRNNYGNPLAKSANWIASDRGLKKK